MREALLKRAKFHLRVGDKAKSIAAYRETEAKTVGSGPKLELALTLVRVGFFFEDSALVADSVQKAKVLVEKLRFAYTVHRFHAGTDRSTTVVLCSSSAEVAIGIVAIV